MHFEGFIYVVLFSNLYNFVIVWIVLISSNSPFKLYMCYESGTITLCYLPFKYILTAKHEMIFRYVYKLPSL
jgi:hypothetical protein